MGMARPTPWGAPLWPPAHLLQAVGSGLAAAHVAGKGRGGG